MTATPHSVHDAVLDQRGLPIAGALVTIRDGNGALVSLDEGNPLITDNTGSWSTSLVPGIYTLVINKGDDAISRTLEVCQDGERTPFIAQVDEINIPTVLDVAICNEANTPEAIGILTITSV